MEFFNTAEIQHFASVAATPYRKANEQRVASGSRLKPLTRKLNEWVNFSISDSYIAHGDNTWQWSGTFKEYLWVRVYKDATINIPQPKVYYVFGINDNEQLYMELNCQRSNHTMGSNMPLEWEKINSFDSYLTASDYQPRYIDAAELQFYNWDRLIRETKDFIDTHAAIYNELLNILDPNNSVAESTGKLNLITKPSKIRSKVSDKPSFRGVEVDFEALAQISKFLGDSGEEIVIEHERKKLSNCNHLDLIEQVMKVKDGEGYDILSFDEQRNQIFIEVKTTTGSEKEPFYLTYNEFAFAEKNKDNYYIYRLCDYRNNPSPGGNLFIWTWQDLISATMKPLQYEVSKD